MCDDQDHKTIDISEGLPHGLPAPQDNSTETYPRSAEYNPQREHAIRAAEPARAIDWSVVDGATPSSSGGDAAAASFA